LHRERFVQLPEIDVPDRRAGALEQLRDGEHRPDAHLARLAAGHREAAEYAERRQALFRCQAIAHHDAGAGAVGELAGVAGGNHAAVDRRLDLRHALERRVRTNPFVLAYGDLARRLRAALLVDHLHRRRHRHDLVVEPAGVARRRGALLAADAVLVLLISRDVIG